MKIKFKLKIYPITENGEEIYSGGFLDILSIDFRYGFVVCYDGYSGTLNGLAQLFLGRSTTEWYLNPVHSYDKRDEPSEIHMSIDDGEYQLIDISDLKKEQK